MAKRRPQGVQWSARGVPVHRKQLVDDLHRSGERIEQRRREAVERGAGAHVSDLADPLDAARRAARDVAAADEALRQAVIEAHTAGASPRQIGDAIGVSHTTVHRWIKA